MLPSGGDGCFGTIISSPEGLGNRYRILQCSSSSTHCEAAILGTWLQHAPDQSTHARPSVPILQSEGDGPVRSCLQEVRPRYHIHLHNVMYVEGRTLRQCCLTMAPR